MPEDPRLSLTGEVITTSDGQHPINFTDPITLGEEYSLVPYIFTDSKGEKADGVVFKIKPNGSSTPMKIVDTEVVIQEIAIRGSGWFLSVNPQETLEVVPVDNQLEQNPLIEQRTGWIGVWIAGAEGLEVLDVTEPHFKDSMETAVQRNDTSINPNFWSIYDQTKAST